jgi:ribokinase
MAKPIVILGVFVADTAYHAKRQPRMGETLLGSRFTLGPGGKGSNQAVACGKLDADVHFITRLGKDPFADMAMKAWKDAGVKPAVTVTPESYTGAAYIFLEEGTGNNAIIIAPGAAALIAPQDIDDNAELIRSASVFVTQMEQPLDAAIRGLEIAKAAGVTTILNPAPAMELPDSIYGLCDYLTPNETEAEGITGIRVESAEDAEKAAHAMVKKGAGGVLVTLGEKGALLHTAKGTEIVPAYKVGPVAETTGAGDAFNGGFAVGLSRGFAPIDAVRFGCAVAGISVTRPGTAPSMPTLAEVEAVLNPPT